MGNQISEYKKEFLEKKKAEHREKAKLYEVKSRIVDYSKNEEKTGFERLKQFYDADTVSMERYMVVTGAKLTFLVTFLMGGMLSSKEVEKRIEVYSQGKNFGSARNKFARQTDLKILQFMKNGFKYSFKCVFATGALLLVNTHLILYKNKFEYWYPPLATATVTGTLAVPLGIHGIVQAGVMGLTGGGIISASVFLYSLYRNLDSPDLAYKEFRKSVEKELDDHQKHVCRVRNFMKQEGISTQIVAEYKLKKRDEESQLSSGLDNISDED
ncbi:unnamed protein product [Bursaphelenchus xylophilus]|uniref:Complex I assembly factor TIMMDC1, mitochondrial n=1 Tax=Bursaphelenchus xylophilus TaxID=6326 RepID=A0A1I7S3K2_BURXY|nr:unnamed protein product [Bursaphelenchus xylophilus]CAG9116368.1 unnamed protein product [Bursaphelenchus xylophilus]